VPCVLTMCLAGCSYTSDYVPPKDGRARAIWKDDKVVVAAPADLPDCAKDEQPPKGYRYDVPLDEHGYYYPPSSNTHVHVGVIIVGRPPVFFLPGSGGGIPSLGNLGGGGKGSEYVFVALAVGAIVAFPFIAMGLALGHPEPEEEVAAGIDEVNAFNDKSRERFARCAAWHRRRQGASE
jgi:hypothetical protein